METTRRIKRGWMNLEVTAIRQDTPDCKTLIFQDLEDRNCPFDYYAGQYLTFRFDDLAPKPIVRSYTMSSSPSKNALIEVTVKEIPYGLVSTYLCRQVKVGDVLRARGPIGAFTFRPEKDHPRLVMLGAGSGVTPFLSILHEHSDRIGTATAPTEMVLLASYRSEVDIIGKAVLDKVKSIPGITVHVTLSREEKAGFLKGRIDAEMIAKACNGVFANTTYMFCGPIEMMDGAHAFLRSCGVAEEHLRTESFFT